MTDESLWQFDLAWELAELHLSALVDDDYLWQPAADQLDGAARLVGCVEARLVRHRTRSAAGADDRLAHLAISWWWSETIDHLSGRTPRERTDVTWAGTGAEAVSRLRALRGQWRELLAGLSPADLEQPSPFPWGSDSGYTVAHTVLWVNIELTKNVAEIGQLRLLRAASRVRYEYMRLHLYR